MNLRFRSNAPRRPPQVVILGPPGSGRTTTAETLCKRYGLVLVSPMNLLNEESKRIPAIKIKVQEALDAGRDIPDEILLRAIDKRLKQSDCRLNGWVLDGFPQNEAQVYLLSSMGIKPSLICILEQSAEDSVSRLKDRSMDPATGQFYSSIQAEKLSDAVKKRLVKQKSDCEAAVLSRF